MKRFWMMLCTVVLLAVVLAVPAVAAEGEHTHCACGGTLETGCEHGELTFTEVSSAGALKTALEGVSPINVCVSEGFTIGESISVSGKTLNLCLNGNTITMSGSAQFLVDTSGALNITDCAETAGAITAAQDSTASLLKANGGVITLYAGTVNATNTASNGGAVYLNKAGDVFTMYGGTLQGSKKAVKGGAVYVGGQTSDATKVNIHGGTIRDGYASELGGNINMNRGVLTITGGTITGGAAGGDTNGLGGGGICVEYNARVMTISGDAKIYGNQGTSATNSTGGADIRLNGHATNNAIKIGDWEGNGEHPAVALVKLSPKAGLKVISFITDGEGNPLAESPYGVKSDFVSVTAGYQLAMFDDTGVTLQNEADHIHCACNGKSTGVGSHVCRDVLYAAKTGEEFTGLFTSNTLTANQNVYLTEGVELAAEYKLGGYALNLCLHGQTVTLSGNGRITSNSLKESGVVVQKGVLNISDCTGSGQILAAEGCRSSILYAYSGSVNLYGGTVDGRACAKGDYGTIRLGVAEDELSVYGGTLYGSQKATSGGAIGMNVAGNIYVYGGTVYGGTVTQGGCIYTNNGTVTVAGGKLTGGQATNGGNIYISGGTLTVSGGTLENGHAAGSGGNIAVFEVSGSTPQLFVTGGTITGGSAAGTAAGQGGGNIAGTSSGGTTTEYPKLTVSGGTIIGGNSTGTVNAGGTTSGGDGGNINMNRGTLLVSGGTVTGGSATGNGCGIQIGYNCKGFTLSGSALIYGNNGRDLHLGTGAADQITLDNWAGNGEKGPMAITSAVGEGAVIAKPTEGGALTAADVAKLTENYDALKLELEEGQILLRYCHSHCLCNGALTHDCAEVEFTEVASADAFLALFDENNNLIADSNVVLTGSFALNAEYKLGGKTLNLCLNGQTLTMSGNGRITANGVTDEEGNVTQRGLLNITDCGNGSITAASGCKQSFLFTYNGDLNLYAGTVDASAIDQGTSSGKSGGAVTVESADDVFTMYGGAISGGTVERGGAVYVNKGGILIHDGIITGGDTKLGGAVAVNWGTFEMYGGTITGGSATQNGAAVFIGYNVSTAPVLGGDAKLYGGTGPETLRLGQRTDKAAKVNYILLDNWAGNGENGPLVVSSLDTTNGCVIAKAMDGSALVEADVAKLDDIVADRKLMLVDGQIVLKFVHTHCLCNGTLTHTCTNVEFAQVNSLTEFTALFDADKVLLADTNVVLTGSFELNAEYKLGGKTLNLCLNGQTLTMSGNGRITANGATDAENNVTKGTLNITACSEAGNIAAASGCKQSFLYTYNGDLNLYAGTVDASKVEQSMASADDKNGGAITAYNENDVFTMYGGRIIGGKLYRGGAVYGHKGHIVIRGGTITGGTATIGGNVAANYGTLAIYGGTITGGTATTGAGVSIGFQSSAPLILSGDAKIYGNIGTEDIDLNQKSADNRYIQLESWQGNGAGNPKLVVERTAPTDGSFAKFTGEVDPRIAGCFASTNSACHVLLDGTELRFTEEAGDIAIQVGSTVILSFSKLQDAVDALEGTDAFIRLNASLTENITADKPLYLDLNGCTLTGSMHVGDNGQLMLIDSNTEDYTVEDGQSYGRITGGITGNFEGAYTFNTPKDIYGRNLKYLVLSDENGVHAHRIYLAVKSANIYPKTTAIKYQTVFYCDEVVAAAISNYGVQFTHKENQETADYGAPAAYGEAGNNNSKIAHLINVLSEDMSEAEQNERMDLAAQVRAYITLEGQEDYLLLSTAKSVSFRQAIQQILTMDQTAANTLTESQKQALIDLHDRYTVIQQTCGCDKDETVNNHIHTWKGDTSCVCLGLAEGKPGHETCQEVVFSRVASAEQFAAYFEGSKLQQDANIRLVDDIALNAEYAVNGHTLNLWLDGHTVTLGDNGRLTANGGGDLNITEAAGGTGKIVVGKCSGLYGYGGTLRIFGGTVDASGVNSPQGNGAAIRLGYNATAKMGSTAYMYGGTVTGVNGEARATVKNGGLVYTENSSSFHMLGGTITGGQALPFTDEEGTTTGGDGGSIYLANHSVFTMSGGSITGGQANRGGNIFITGSSATATVTGGSLTDGAAVSAIDSDGGGNLYITSGATATISGGTVSGGTASGFAANAEGKMLGSDGGNININNGTLNLTGGTVTGGQVQSEYGNGNGIYLGWNGNMTLSGTAQLLDNNGEDLCLSGNTDKKLVLGAWSGNESGTKLLLNRAVDSESIQMVTFSDVEEADRPALAEKLGSAKEGYNVVLRLDGSSIYLMKSHDHCLCGPTHTSVGDHTQEAAASFVRVYNKNEFDSLFDASRVLTQDRNVLLVGSFTLEEEYSVGGHTLNLCLGGKTLTLKTKGRLTANASKDEAGNVVQKGTINITDCAGSGQIKAAADCRTSILYTYNGHINLYGGKVDGSACAKGDYGTVRLGVAQDTFAIYGGELVGSQKATYGGAIGMNVAAGIYVYGGTLTGGEATNGGNIYASAGTVTISGGTVTGGTASANGGNIAIYENNSTPQLFITGGTISDGTANGQQSGQGGGNIGIIGANKAEYPLVTVSGGTVSGGKASGLVNEDGSTVGGDGGNINMNRGTLVLTGGTVTGGSATGNGDGITVGYFAMALQLSGEAKIYGNATRDIALSTHSNNKILLGAWAGNGEGKAAPTIQKLFGSSDTTLAGKRVVEFAKDSDGNLLVSDPYGSKALFASADANYQLARTEANGLTLQAADAHMHCLCGGELAGTEGHSCLDTVFAPVTAAAFAVDTDKENPDAAKLFESWTDGNIRLKTNANICLAEDITLEAAYVTSGHTLNLCLGEHTLTVAGEKGRLTANRAKGGSVNGMLNITACDEGGKITSGEGCKSGFLYTWNGSINLYSGTVDLTGKSIYAVKVDTNGAGDTFTMHGGTIKAGAAAGGAVYVNGGTAIMNGGLITAEGNEIGGNGGAVYVASNAKAVGSFLMNGGQIVGGTANRGGAVYVTGSFTMNGGSITGGAATTYGGNVAVARSTINEVEYDGSFTMNAGSITGGTALWGGGNLFFTGSDGVINGGSVTGGISSADGSDLDNHFGGGNICVGYESDLTLTGGSVTGGTCGMGRSDIAVQPNSFTTNLSGAPTVDVLYLVGKSLTIDTALTGGNLGVILRAGVGELAAGAGAVDSAAYLTSLEGYQKVADGDRLLLQTAETPVYMVGYGEASIKPSRKDVNNGLRLQGFSNEHHVTDMNTQVEDLYATAMAVTDAEGDTVLIISADACTVTTSQSNKIRLNISRTTGIPVENIAISLCHQHSTPAVSTIYYRDADGNYTDAEGNPVAEADRVIKTDYATTFYAGILAAAENAVASRVGVENMQLATVETRGKGANGASFNYVRNVKYQASFRPILGGTAFTETGMITDNHNDFKTDNSIITRNGTNYAVTYKALGYESNVDHTMQLMKYTLKNGKSVILANFQTHPHLGANPTTPRIHSDLVGAFRDALSTLSGAEVIYFSGASGDVNPRDTYLGGTSYEKETLWEYLDYGADLAALANSATYTTVASASDTWDVKATETVETLNIRDDLEGLTDEEKTDLLTRAANIAANGYTDAWINNVEQQTNKALRLYSKHHANALLNREKTLRPADGSAAAATSEVTLSAFSLGPVAVINAPYEMFQVNGQQIKGIRVDESGAVTKEDRTDGFEMIIVASKSNGSEGYIPSADGYANGGYSTDTSWFTAGTGEYLVSKYQQLLVQLNPKN